MPAIVVSSCFDEERIRSLPHRLQNGAKAVTHFPNVHAVHNHRWHVVALGTIRQFLYRRGTLDMRSHSKQVVLANENDRQLPQSRQIARFVEDTLIDGAVTKEAQRAAILTSIAAGKSHSSCEGQVTTHNGVAAVHVILLVEIMHRAAETL